ncbi:MAG: Hg(II)-responsive transcriptional regulator [Luteimonas sp.]
MTEELTIGRVAKLAAVNVETVRYYQRRGLLDEPLKPVGACRRYPAAAAKRIRFIKRAQALGFTLEEVADLLRLEETHACAETRKLAVHKVAVIERKMTNLAAMREALDGLIGQCDAGQTDGACPIIQSLARD